MIVLPAWLSFSNATAVIGLVGLTTLYEWVSRTRRWKRLQRFLRLAFRDPLDIVLTTSSLSPKEGFAQSQNDRLHAQLGYLKAAAIFAQAAGTTNGKKPVAVHVGQGVTSPLDGDLVLLGGPAGNPMAQRFLDYLRSNAPDLRCEFDESDETANRMCADGVELTYNWREVACTTHLYDYAMIVFWVNPFTAHRRRAIFCAGFTAAGTHAAATYVMTSFFRDRLKQITPPLYAAVYQRLKRGARTLSFPSVRPFARWPHFVMLLEIRFINDVGFDITERALTPIALPTAHLHPATSVTSSVPV